MNNIKLKIGKKYEIKIEKIVFGGEGLGYFNDFAVFVPMSVPGDTVEIEIISSKKTYARGLIRKIINPSPERIEDTSKISFEDFYGCDFAMLKYENQLKYKKIMVEDVMKRLAGLDNFPIEDVVPSDNIYHYRNKIIEPFSFYDNKIITGFFKRKSHDIFEVEENILNSVLGNKIIKSLKELLNEYKISVYDEINHKGLLRNVMIRTNSNNEAMLVLIINSNKVNEKIKDILLKFKDKFSEIKSIYISLNSKKVNTVIGEKNILIYGAKTIKENINGIDFHISPTSFFQINIEIVKSASEDGEKTALENGINNIEFINGAVEDKLDFLINNSKKIDTIIFDPPRKGLDSSIIDKVSDLNLQEIVYISCNPSTLARDIKLFKDKGYSLKTLKTVDMFPQTSHIECVALISRI